MPAVVTLTMNPALDVSSRTATVRPTHKLRCDRVQRQAGGGGINVARLLHRLNIPVLAVAALGGTTGSLVAELLTQQGVVMLPVPIGGHTRESFTVVESTPPSGAQHRASQEYRFVLPGPELLETEWRACLDAVQAVQPAPAWVVASGSLPPGVPNDIYARLAKTCRLQGSRLIVDASGPALSAALDAGVFLVKPSLGEMRSLSARPLETMGAVVEVAQSWLADGKAQVVMVSMGEQGALMVTAQETLLAPALPVTVASAVGAGDSFVAGVVYGFLQGGNLQTAFAWGVAAASASIQAGGLDAVTPSDMKALYLQVKAQAVDSRVALQRIAG